MGFFNRLCIRQLRKSVAIVDARIRLAEAHADKGFADAELHAQRMRSRRDTLLRRIAEREEQEK
jgi:hypothetical protein